MSKRQVLRDLKKYSKNPAVSKVTGSNIQFSEEFKIKAIKRYRLGESAITIFEDAGIDLKDFGNNYAGKAIARWLKVADEHGIKNLNKERRGINSTGRPGITRFKTIEEENAYLRAENDFLKKLHALEQDFVRKKSTK